MSQTLFYFFGCMLFFYAAPLWATSAGEVNNNNAPQIDSIKKVPYTTDYQYKVESKTEQIKPAQASPLKNTDVPSMVGPSHSPAEFGRESSKERPDSSLPVGNFGMPDNNGQFGLPMNLQPGGIDISGSSDEITDFSEQTKQVPSVSEKKAPSSIGHNTSSLPELQYPHDRLRSLFANEKPINTETLSDGLSPNSSDSKQQTLTDRAQPHWVPGEIIISAEDTEKNRKTIKDLTKEFQLHAKKTYTLTTLNINITVFQTSALIPSLVEKINKHSLPIYSQPNFTFSTLTDPLNHMQVIHKELQLDKLHASYQGEGVAVAVIDTGVAVNHKDLKKKNTITKNFVDDSEYCQEIHGTGVAGLIAAEKNNIGISGVAPKASIIALRACRQIQENRPEGECSSSSVAQALDFAIQAGADIINMSLGMSSRDPLLAKLLDKASAENILLVAPAGNDIDQNQLTFPASHVSVLSVAGIDRAGNPVPNATVAALADIAAPSNQLFTTLPEDRYNFLSGTSLSAAVISGLLAITVEKYGRSTPKHTPPFNQGFCQWAEKLLQFPLCRKG
ncbi:MAG: S8 family serine peptidase [Proteobacteria bacterium]|nr:S8 family serine peptidase [Pseudomonadota bacterium]